MFSSDNQLSVNLNRWVEVYHALSLGLMDRHDRL